MQAINGQVYVVAAPSGAGKTSLVAALLQRLPHLSLSISHTTRALRTGEKEGLNYHFVDQTKFNEMVKAGEFIEHAKVFGHCYGTSKAWLQQQLSAGEDVVLEIDWQGARKIKQSLPNSVGIFILPPSVTSLRERLTRRGQDDEQVIATRMQAAQCEMSHYQDFDYVVVNDDFDRTLDDLTAIVRASRLTLAQQEQKQNDLLQTLSLDLAKTK